MPKWFGEYTELIATVFGDRVKNFITFNEIEAFVGLGYYLGIFAPGYRLSTPELVHIGHNVLKSHGEAVKILRNIKGSKIGIATASEPQCPVSDDKKDIDAARNGSFWNEGEAFAFSSAYWLDAVFFGKYPDWVYNLKEINIPNITEDDMKLISQKIDFIGTNIYRGNYVSAEGVIPHAVGSPQTLNGWPIVPESLCWGPYFMNERYKVPVFITENGISCPDVISLDNKVHDDLRQDYLHRYILQMKKAIDMGADIQGYFEWSLFDNFEWADGYHQRFGLIYVDYNTRERIIKDSAYWYRSVIESGGKCL